tara:strand:- start:557 stop:1273 length:717 start_codon:yes stop_codon:yes gene_type:complete
MLITFIVPVLLQTSTNIPQKYTYRVKLYPWLPKTVYRLPSVYYTGEIRENSSEWIKFTDNASFNNQNTLGFCPHCIKLRNIIRSNIVDEISCSIIFMQRQNSRRVYNSQQMIKMLRENFPQYRINEFQIVNNNISYLREIMGTAAVLIAPHGAGIANIPYLPTDAIVVELAYTGTRSMKFPVNYYNIWSQSCNNTHILSTAYGNYNTGMEVHLPILKSVLKQAINYSLPHKSKCAFRS